MKAIQAGVVASTAVMCLMGIFGLADAMPIIQDMCNQTSGDGQGHTCPGPNDLLLRPRYSDGTCGDWICCSPNPDGRTYDCEHGSSPASAISGAVRGALGSRFSVLQGGSSPGTKKPPIFQNPNAPIMRRGVEGEQPGPSGGTTK